MIFLNDKDKIRFLISCKKFIHLLHVTTFNDKIYDYNRIKNISYYHRFKRVGYTTNSLIIPDGITHLFFNEKYNNQINRKLPSTIIHIYFGNNFNNKILKERLPESITHLTFGHNFDQSVQGCIP